MFYTLSKLAFFLIQPSSVAIIALAAGVVVWHTRPQAPLGFRLTLAGLAGLLIGGLSPLGNLLILPLEERFARTEPGATSFEGVIILGGFEDGWVSARRGELAVNEAAERLTEGVRIARRHPALKVVFTGGVGSFWGEAAAEGVADYLVSMGIDRSRIVLEGQSRNTHENALFTRDVLRPQPGSKWLLVTSAFHMPRAMGVFRAAGFDVAAYPVDYRTRDAGDLLRPFERVPAGLERLDLAAKEWIGLVAYRATGRSAALWPVP